MHKLKHTKIRNTGLLFEFLLRQITSDVLNNTEKSIAVNIVIKGFNENITFNIHIINNHHFMW